MTTTTTTTQRKIIINVEGNISPEEMTKLMDGLQAIKGGFDFYVHSGLFISAAANHSPKAKSHRNSSTQL